MRFFQQRNLKTEYSIHNVFHRFKFDVTKTNRSSQHGRKIKVRDFTNKKERFDMDSVYLQEIKTMDYYLKKGDFHFLHSLLDEHEIKDLIRILYKYVPFVKENEDEYQSYLLMLKYLQKKN